MEAVTEIQLNFRVSVCDMGAFRHADYRDFKMVTVSAVTRLLHC